MSPRNEGRAAAAVGCTVEEYRRHAEAGEKWCGGCKQWHPRSAFGRDASRGDGLATRCRQAKNGHPDHDTPTGRPRGRRRVAARDGDRVQARQRVARLVLIGALASPRGFPCRDCGHEWKPGGRPHEYDHYRGYAAEHHEHVEPVCSPCHYVREVVRGAHDNANRTARPYRRPPALSIPASHVAALLGVDPVEVDELVARGELRMFPPGTDTKLVTMASWRRFLASAGVEDVAS